VLKKQELKFKGSYLQKNAFKSATKMPLFMALEAVSTGCTA
jgi:hypothetical protein